MRALLRARELGTGLGAHINYDIIPAVFALIAVLDEQVHAAVFAGARRVSIPIRDGRACACKARDIGDGAMLVCS